jgi:hypothetical protein
MRSMWKRHLWHVPHSLLRVVTFPHPKARFFLKNGFGASSRQGDARICLHESGVRVIGLSGAVGEAESYGKCLVLYLGRMKG